MIIYILFSLLCRHLRPPSGPKIHAFTQFFFAIHAFTQTRFFGKSGKIFGNIGEIFDRGERENSHIHAKIGQIHAFLQSRSWFSRSRKFFQFTHSCNFFSIFTHSRNQKSPFTHSPKPLGAHTCIIAVKIKTYSSVRLIICFQVISLHYVIFLRF